MFIASYDRERLFIKQLEGVYSVFEYLDKEYITAIMASIGSTKIASNQAKAAGKDAQKALKEVQATLVTQSKLIDKLTEFKTATQNDICKINEFRTVTENTTHFKDIDEMWNDINSFREFNDRLETLVEGRYNELLNVIKECEDSQSNLILRVDGHENILNDVENSLDKLKKRVDGILHFDDIDTIWEKNEKNEKTLADLKNDFEETRDKIIVNHQEFEKKVGQLVKQIETSEAKHSDDIIEVKQKSDKNAMDVSSLNTEQSEIIQKINRLEQENHELSGKISIAESMIEKNNHQYKKVVYFLIGIGFATLTIIVLNICGVL